MPAGRAPFSSSTTVSHQKTLQPRRDASTNHHRSSKTTQRQHHHPTNIRPRRTTMNNGFRTRLLPPRTPAEKCEHEDEDLQSPATLPSCTSSRDLQVAIQPWQHLFEHQQQHETETLREICYVASLNGQSKINQSMDRS